MIKPKKYRIIILVGLSGSGKTSIGKVYAEAHDYAFLDSDTEIEKKTTKSISEIFSEGGEQMFRKHEKDFILDISPRQDMVISVGGGALTQNEVLQFLKAHGHVVYLKVNIEELTKRLLNSVQRRPLLKSQSPEQIQSDLCKQLEKRRSNYLKADTVINAEGTQKEVLKRLASLIREA